MPMLRFKEVMASAGSASTKMVDDLTNKIRMDDACNIQVSNSKSVLFSK